MTQQTARHWRAFWFAFAPTYVRVTLWVSPVWGTVLVYSLWEIAHGR